MSDQTTGGGGRPRLGPHGGLLAGYALALLALGLLAWNAARLERAARAAAALAVVVARAGPGREADLRVGNRLVVLLEAPGGADAPASAWSLEPRDYWPLAHLSSGGRAPGTQEFLFAAKAPGLVRLVFLRPSRTGANAPAPAVQTLFVNVR